VDQLIHLDEKSLLEPNIQFDTWTMHAVVRDGIAAVLKSGEKESFHRFSAEFYLGAVPSKIKKLEDVEGLEEALYHYSEANLADEVEENLR